MIQYCNFLCAAIMGYGCGFRSFLREPKMEGLHVPTHLESKAQKMKAAIQSKLQVNLTKTRPNETYHCVSQYQKHIKCLCVIYMRLCVFSSLHGGFCNSGFKFAGKHLHYPAHGQNWRENPALLVQVLSECLNCSLKYFTTLNKIL